MNTYKIKTTTLREMRLTQFCMIEFDDNSLKLFIEYVIKSEYLGGFRPKKKFIFKNTFSTVLYNGQELIRLLR